MSSDAVKTLVQAFISCRLNYCNSMFYGITDGLMSRLQSVQNAAARLVSGARRYDHITPVTGAALASGLASGGLQNGHSGLLVTVRYDSTLPGRRLSAGLRRRSSSAALCQLKDMCRQKAPIHIVARKSRFCSYGDRCFAATGPRLWNSLPAHLRQTDINFEQFKRQFKTFLFRR